MQTTARSCAPGHRRLDLAPLLGGQRAVVQGDGQVVLVQPPQLLEGELGLEAGVDEDQRRPGPLDRLIDLGHGVVGGVAGPGHLAFRQQHVDDRRRARRAAHQVHVLGAWSGASQRRITSGSSTVAERPTRRRLGRELLQAGEAQRQQVAALGGPDGVDLVDDHAAQVLEIAPRALPGAEQGQLLGRGQQDVRRLHPLALAAGRCRCRRCATSALIGRPISTIGRHQVALDVDRQRLQRRDVEGVHARAACWRRGPLGELDQAGQEAGQGLAAAGGRDQQGVAARPSPSPPSPAGARRAPAARLEPVGEARRQGGEARRVVHPRAIMFPFCFSQRFGDYAFDKRRSRC